MALVRVGSEPQGPAYLPPSGGVAPRPGGGGGGGGHPDEWAGVFIKFHFIPNSSIILIQ